VERLTALPLLAAALLAAAPAAGRVPAGAASAVEAVRPLVAEVELRLPPGEAEETYRPLLGLRPGDPVTPRALQRLVRNLYQTGKFGNVLVFSFPVPGDGPPRVRLEVRCLPKRTVASLAVTGLPAGVSEESLLQATGLARGSEIFPGRLEQAAAALRRLLSRQGYQHATVTPDARGDPRLDVVFEVVAGEPTRVRSVVVGPDTGVPEEVLRKAVRLEPGAILDAEVLETAPSRIRDDLRRAGYYRARVGTPQVEVEGNSATVRVPVEAGPLIVFRFAGNLPFPEAQLRERLGYEGEVPFDVSAVEGATERLRAFLASYGFNAARVWTEEARDGGRIVYRFHVDAGRRYFLRAVRFEGASFWTAGELRRKLREAFEAAPPAQTRQPRADLDAMAQLSGLPVVDPAPILTSDPDQVYNAESWKQGMERLTDAYRNEGYLDAVVDVAEVSLDARNGWADVGVNVKEGVQTLVGSVSFEGSDSVSAEELAKAAGLAPGSPLSLTRVAAARQAVLERHQRKGYVYVRVELSQAFNPDRTRADLRFRIDEGPQVTVAAVVVEGNKRTNTALIERVVGFRAGQVFDPEAAAIAQSDLLRLGVFRSVNIHLSDPDVPQASKTVLVQVEERPWQTVVASLGLSFAEGPRAGLEYALPNVFGNALEFGARGKVNYPLEIFRPDLQVIPPAERVEWLAELGLRKARAFDLSAVSLRGDLVGQHKIQAAYQLLRGALIAGADLIRLGRVSASLTGQLEVDDVTSRTAYPIIDASNNAGEARQLFPVGLTWLFSIQPRVSLDLRDNAARPTFGLYAEVAADYSHSIGTTTTVIRSDTYINLVKLSGILTGYLPLGPVVLAMSAQGGRIFALSSASVTIAPKRFYLGGATTMRGYGENEMIPQDQRAQVALQTQRCASVLSGLGCSPQLQQLVRNGVMLPSEGGQASVLFKMEVRIPMSQATEIGVFADFGNLWFDQTLVNLGKLRTNVGIGFRVLTPVGPAAFDVGFNLNPDYAINEPVFAPHFAVGFF
jgi:outer membrane protein insertion porin family